MEKQKLIVLRGYPGSGKTTIGKELEKRGRGVLVDHNSILNFLAGIAGNDDGIYDEIHSLEKSIARKLLHDKKSAIVARGFSARVSIVPYSDLARDMGAELCIFKLAVSESNLIKRVTSEERKKDFNPTISEDILMTWIKDNPIEDVEQEYEVDADRTIGEVIEQILTHLSP